MISELGLQPGREVGRLLEDLTERVVAEPALNDRVILLELARNRLAEDVEPPGSTSKGD